MTDAFLNALDKVIRNAKKMRPKTNDVAYLVVLSDLMDLRRMYVGKKWMP